MKILIIRVSAIGDVIHTLPALFLLKQQIPNASISWVVQKKAAALLHQQPSLENVWILDDHFLAPKNIRATMRIMKDIRKHNWDAIVDFQGLLKTSLLAMMLNGKKFGFTANHARERLSTWFTHHHCTPEYTNIIQKNLALASTVVWQLTNATTNPTLDSLKQTFAFNITPAAHATVNAWLSTQGIKHPILLCPNTTWESKHWPLERWQELIAEQQANHQAGTAPLVLVGQHAGAAAQQLARWIEKNKLPVYCTPPWDLMTTAALITHAAVVIAPDTGLLHLADFLGTPSIGIFGPTLKDRHGPFLSKNNMTNAIQIPCQHHYAKTHGTSSDAHNCMLDLKTAMVTEKIHALVGQTKDLL